CPEGHPQVCVSSFQPGVPAGHSSTHTKLELLHCVPPALLHLLAEYCLDGGPDHLQSILIYGLPSIGVSIKARHAVQASSRVGNVAASARPMPTDASTNATSTYTTRRTTAFAIMRRRSKPIERDPERAADSQNDEITHC